MAKQTLDEKTDDFMHRLYSKGFSFDGKEQEEIRSAFQSSIISQNRDDRHAHADLVIGMGQDTGFTGKKYVNASEAHAAIINCKGGIE